MWVKSTWLNGGRAWILADSTSGAFALQLATDSRIKQRALHLSALFGKLRALVLARREDV